MFRSYLAMQQFDIVLDEITDSPNTPVGKNKKPIDMFWCCVVLIFYWLHCSALRAIRILATYLSKICPYEQCLAGMSRIFT